MIPAAIGDYTLFVYCKISKRTLSSGFRTEAVLYRFSRPGVQKGISPLDHPGTYLKAREQAYSMMYICSVK